MAFMIIWVRQRRHEGGVSSILQIMFVLINSLRSASALRHSLRSALLYYSKTYFIVLVLEARVASNEKVSPWGVILPVDHFVVVVAVAR